jgi:hypothetical protein
MPRLEGTFHLDFPTSATVNDHRGPDEKSSALGGGCKNQAGGPNVAAEERFA